MKYTFEIMKKYEDAFRGISVYSVSEDKKLMVDFVAIEELEDAQKEIDEAYQRGLNDAWEAARRIALMDTETSENVTGYFGLFRIMENLTPMQAIEKLKAYYEEKQKADDEIKIGDEVIWKIDDIKLIITSTYKVGGLNWCDGVAQDGKVYSTLAKNNQKTGKHYDIQSILEAMRNG